MKFDIKKLYHDSVKQLEKHQVEISTALAILALAARSAEPVDPEEEAAKAELASMYQDLLDVLDKHITAINDKLGVDDAAS